MTRRERALGAGLANAVIWAGLLATTAPSDAGAQVGAAFDAVTVQSPEDLEACERFATLRSTQKAMLVARVRGRLVQEGYPAYARIRGLGFDVYEAPEAEAPPVFDAETRTRVHADAAAHAAVSRRFARTPLLGDLHVHVYYDWATGQIVQNEVPPGYDAVFCNLLNGYPPETDQAIAAVMKALDQDAEMRKSADWFGHAYTDLERRAFLGTTLYDAWYSGEPVDVPDIDAVAFARNILRTKKYRSPLSGKPRDRLYEAIGKNALEYRKHRTMREAAAAAFVHDAPPMDEIYGRLVPRFHYLFAKHDDSLERVGDVLDHKSRDALIEEIDELVARESSDAWKISEERRAELSAMRLATRRFTLMELASFAGPPVQRN